MRLFSRGLINGLIFALVNGVGLYAYIMMRLVLRWAYTLQFTVCKYKKCRCENDKQRAVLHRCSYEEVFRKYTANLQENTHAQV